MSAILSKTRSILTRDDRYSEEEFGKRWFIQTDEETGIVRRNVYVDVETFQDLGEPDTITVTIEPGDTLN